MARDLGYPVSVLRASMPHSEFLGWRAYYDLEPIGDDRADWRAALQSAVLANLHRDPKKRRQAYGPDDFRLRFHLPEPEEQAGQSIQATASLVEMLQAAFGGEIQYGEAERRRGGEAAG